MTSFFKFFNPLWLVENYLTLHWLGSGKSSSSTPSSIQSTSGVFAPFAATTGENLLGLAAGLTGVPSTQGGAAGSNLGQYVPYQGVAQYDSSGNITGYAQPEATAANNYLQAGPSGQVAGFTPLQNESFNSAGNMQVAPQLGNASTMAAQSGLGSMNTADSAMGYGQAGAGYGAQGAQIGTQGGAQYGQMGANYGAQGAGIGQQAINYGQNAANQAANTAYGYGAQAAGLSNQAQNYGGMGANYGAQAAQLSNTALGYGQGASNIGMQAQQQAQGLGQNISGQSQALAAQQAAAGQNYANQATNPGAVQSYMNPYLQASLAPQMALLQQQQGQQQAANQARATQSGAFGGSREGVEDALQNQSNQLAMSNLIGQGYNTAYNQALQNMQFGTTAGMQGMAGAQSGLAGAGLGGGQLGLSGANTALQGQQGALSGVGQAGSMYGLGMQGAQAGLSGVNAANQAYQTGLSSVGQGINAGQLGMSGYNTGLQGTGQGISGAQAGLQGVGQQLAGTAQGMQGAQTGLQGVSGAQAGYNAANTAAANLGNLGNTQYQQQTGIANLQNQLGAQQQQYQQNLDTAAYQNYLSAKQLPYQQLSYLASIMNSQPTSGSTTSIYSNPSPISIAAGLGTAAIGASKLASSSKKGGLLKEKRMATGGLAALAVSKMR